RFQIFAASRSASSVPSVCVTPTRTSSPGLSRAPTTSPSTVTLASVTRWMTARIRSFWHAHPRPHRPPKCDVVGQENPYCDVERHSRSRAGEHLPHLGPESSADLVRESSAVNHESTYGHVRKSLCRNPPGSAMLNEDRCCDGTCRASR